MSSKLASLLLALSLPLTLVACVSAGDPGDPGAGDDTPPGDDPPATGEQCLLPADYADLGALDMGNAIVVPQQAAAPDGPKVVIFNVSLVEQGAPAGAPEDLLHLELWDGAGVFTGGFKTGTFQLTGDETDYFKCGACVVLAADINPANNLPTKFYMATGGTLTLTAMDPTVGTGKVTGTLTGVTFDEVDVSGDAQVPAAGSCTSSVGGFSFNLTVQAPAT
jgi:hypothetical protein